MTSGNSGSTCPWMSDGLTCCLNRKKIILSRMHEQFKIWTSIINTKRHCKGEITSRVIIIYEPKRLHLLIAFWRCSYIFTSLTSLAEKGSNRRNISKKETRYINKPDYAIVITDLKQCSVTAALSSSCFCLSLASCSTLAR